MLPISSWESYADRCHSSCPLTSICWSYQMHISFSGCVLELFCHEQCLPAPLKQQQLPWPDPSVQPRGQGSWLIVLSCHNNLHCCGARLHGVHEGRFSQCSKADDSLPWSWCCPHPANSERVYPDLHLQAEHSRGGTCGSELFLLVWHYIQIL